MRTAAEFRIVATATPTIATTTWASALPQIYNLQISKLKSKKKAGKKKRNSENEGIAELPENTTVSP